MPRLDFVALEPDPARWQVIRAGLQATGRDGVAVSRPSDLAAVLAAYAVEELLIGRCGTVREHAAVLQQLRNRAKGPRIRVVGDRNAPRRVAEYLRLGGRVIAPSQTNNSTPRAQAA